MVNSGTRARGTTIMFGILKTNFSSDNFPPSEAVEGIHQNQGESLVIQREHLDLREESLD
jgi:hypothetical protein